MYLSRFILRTICVESNSYSTQRSSVIPAKDASIKTPIRRIVTPISTSQKAFIRCMNCRNSRVCAVFHLPTLTQPNRVKIPPFPPPILTALFPCSCFVDTQKCANLTHQSLFEMRTNIDIDDGLMRRAMRSVNSRTKRGAVEAGLRLLIQTRGQTGIRRIRGKIRWHGNLSRSRRGRNSS